LRRFATEQGISIEYSTEIAPARGVSSGGKITLLPGQSPAEEFSTLAHEIAHEFLHRGDRRVNTAKRVRETEAEERPPLSFAAQLALKPDQRRPIMWR
jgi:hypothetical protein